MSSFRRLLRLLVCVFINGPATTELYTLSLHDALPICSSAALAANGGINMMENSSPRKIMCFITCLIFIRFANSNDNDSHLDLQLLTVNFSWK